MGMIGKGPLAAGLLILVMGVMACADMAVKTPVGDVVWTRFQEQKKQQREAAVARYNYCPTGGCVIRFEEVQVSPSRAPRGQTFTLTTSYTLLTPEDVPIPVTQTREIFYQGKSLGRVTAIEGRNKNGTWTQKSDFALPPGAAPGVYTLVTRLSTGYGQDERQVTFSAE